MEEHLLDDVDAYVSELVQLYEDRLLCYVRSLIDSNLNDPAGWKAARADPEDIVQRTFERTYVNLRASRKILTHPFAYLRSTARNVFFDLLRQKKNEVTTESLDLKKKFGFEERETSPIEQLFFAPAYDQPEQCVVDLEDVCYIKDAITLIPHKVIQKVMCLKCDGYTPSQIAEELCLPEGSVKNYIHRGREELRMYLVRKEKKEDKAYGI